MEGHHGGGGVLGFNLTSQYVRVLHHLPHYGVSPHLHHLNGSETSGAAWDPANHEYLSSLGLIAAVGVAIGLLTALGLLMGLFVACCCASSPYRRRHRLLGRAPSPGCRNALFRALLVFALLGLGAVCFTNFRVADALDDFYSDLDDMVDTTHTLTAEVDDLLNNISDASARAKAVLPLLPDNSTIVPYVEEFRTSVVRVSGKVAHIRDVIIRLHAGDYVRKVDTILNWRSRSVWIVAAVVALMTVLFGFCLRSRRSGCCAVTSFVLLAITSLGLLWLVVSAHAGLAVGIADFCTDPNAAVQALAHQSQVTWYLNCNSAAATPDDGQIEQALDILKEVKFRTSVDALAAYVKAFPNLPYSHDIASIVDDAHNTNSTLRELQVGISCESVHNQYVATLYGLCDRPLDAISWMMVATLSTIVCLFFVVLLANMLWKWYRFHRDAAAIFDEETEPLIGTINAGGQRRRRRREPSLPSPPYESPPAYTRSLEPPANDPWAHAASTPARVSEPDPFARGTRP